MVMSNTLVHRKNKNKKYNVRFFLLCSPVLVPQIAGGDIPPGFVTVYNQDGKLGESLIQCKPFRVKFFVIHSSQKFTLSIVGRPNLQKVPETLLPGARLRAFSKLFLDLASFF